MPQTARQMHYLSGWRTLYLTYDPYGVMFRRGDPDFRLAVNRALAQVFRSGEIAAIYAKWFDPIFIPMSPLLKAAFELQAIPD